MRREGERKPEDFYLGFKMSISSDTEMRKKRDCSGEKVKESERN